MINSHLHYAIIMMTLTKFFKQKNVSMWMIANQHQWWIPFFSITYYVVMMTLLIFIFIMLMNMLMNVSSYLLHYVRWLWWVMGQNYLLWTYTYPCINRGKSMVSMSLLDRRSRRSYEFSVVSQSVCNQFISETALRIS